MKWSEEIELMQSKTRVLSEIWACFYQTNFKKISVLMEKHFMIGKSLWKKSESYWIIGFTRLKNTHHKEFFFSDITILSTGIYSIQGFLYPFNYACVKVA